MAESGRLSVRGLFCGGNAALPQVLNPVVLPHTTHLPVPAARPADPGLRMHDGSGVSLTPPSFFVRLDSTVELAATKSAPMAVVNAIRNQRRRY
jgi:hypothetical protein